MTEKLRSGLTAAAVLLPCVMAVAGCGALRPLDDTAGVPDRRPEPWSELEVLGHIRGFNGRQTNGRPTGSAGFAQAAEYARMRMKEYGLQPVTAGSYRHLYFTPLNSATDARVVRFGPDTLVVEAGRTLAADPRSAAGLVRSDGVRRVSGPAGPPGTSAPIVVVGPADTSTARLRGWFEAGARAVIETVPPTPGRVARPIGSLLVVQMAPEQAALVLDTEPGDPADGIRGGLRVEVAGAFEPGAAALNVLGYVAGRDPFLASELVVIAAALDGPGQIPGSTGPDTTHVAVAASAVLESARVLADMAAFGEGPDRTVLFALWSGSHQGGAGAAAWIRNPSWPADATVKVIDVGGLSARPFRTAGYSVQIVGSDEIRPGPGDPLLRAVTQATTLARDVLVVAADVLWHRNPDSRIPPPKTR